MFVDPNDQMPEIINRSGMDKHELCSVFEESMGESAVRTLEYLERLVDCEEKLTFATARVLPLIGALRSNPRVTVLSSPNSMQQVEEILAYSRTLAYRTSAPTGWNPSLPMIGFATPNPLPHQVRGGVLGAMQLKLAKQESEIKTKSPEKRVNGDKVQPSKALESKSSVPPLDNKEARERLKRMANDEAKKRKKARQEEVSNLHATMNLSDSSSSSEDESEDHFDE